MFYSIIVPVYNRPDEVRELLYSLAGQTYKNFEVLIVEDGSEQTSESVVESFRNRLNIRYFLKPNSGPGLSRNYGFERATGDYFIIFDSDCLIPSTYLEIVNNRLTSNYLDSYGGPDAAHESFTDIQKAISYSMTSYFTTGGIRGKKKNLGPYHPRSFNMGISRKVYETVGGYSSFRSGEDIEFSIRIIKAGFKTGLISEAFVYHKRRTDFEQFYRQARAFGIGRINVSTVYPEEIKIVHFFPALFTLYLIFTALMVVISKPLFVILYTFLVIYMFAIFIDASIQNKSVSVGSLAVFASLIQLVAYGTGFMTEYFKRHLLKRPHDTDFRY